MNEDVISEIIGDAEAIRTLIDDMIGGLNLLDRHRLHAIYKLTEDLIKNAYTLSQELKKE